MDGCAGYIRPRIFGLIFSCSFYGKVGEEDLCPRGILVSSSFAEVLFLMKYMNSISHRRYKIHWQTFSRSWNYFLFRVDGRGAAGVSALFALLAKACYVGRFTLILLVCFGQ